MSSSNNNTTYKKTSFLAGNNSEFINEFYADYISDPNSLPESWRKFFEGLSDDEKLVYDNLRGPSWSPEKKIKLDDASLTYPTVSHIPPCLPVFALLFPVFPAHSFLASANQRIPFFLRT